MNLIIHDLNEREWDNQTLCGLFWLLAQRSGTMCHEGWLQPHGSLNP